MLEFATDDEVAALIGVIEAGLTAEVVVFAVVLERLAVIDLRLEAGERGVEDEVHHAGDCVRAVCRRGAAGHRFGPAYHDAWNQIEIDRAAIGAWHESMTVQQGQRAGAEERIQAAQVGKRGAHIEVAETDVCGRGEVRVLRHLGNDVADVDNAHLLHELPVHDGDRHRRFEAGALNVRPGDDDLTDRSLGCRCLLSLVVLGKGRGPREGNRQRQNADRRHGTEPAADKFRMSRHRIPRVCFFVVPTARSAWSKAGRRFFVVGKERVGPDVGRIDQCRAVFAG